VHAYLGKHVCCPRFENVILCKDSYFIVVFTLLLTEGQASLSQKRVVYVYLRSLRSVHIFADIILIDM